MIVARNLTQRYMLPNAEEGAPASGDSSERALTVLAGVDLEIAAGEVVVVLGPSGSGKTTLLGLLAGLDRPSDGEVEIDGTPFSSLDEEERALMRASRLGFIFQSFHLLPTLTAIENVLVPLELLPSDRAPDSATAFARAESLLESVGLAHRLDHYPSQLSGGEQQRVGIARAFANDPVVLFADEPTGNLDRSTGLEVADLLFELNRERGTTLVIVTHDLELSRRAHRIIHLDSGRIERIENVTPLGASEASS